MAQARMLRFLPAMVAVSILLVLIARVVESSDLAAQEFVQTGLLYDKVCYMGSYLIVCPYTAPPYETVLLIQVALFVVAMWARPRLQQRPNKN